MPKVSEWLSSMDSHVIYTEDDLDGLGDCDNIAVVREDAAVSLHYKEAVQTQYLLTADEIRLAMAQRGLGGTFDPGDYEYFFTGWEMATNLAFLIAHKYPTKMGRGGRFREAISLIKEAGE